MVTHYHVMRHSGDDDPFISEDLFEVLDYLATELRDLADMENDGISGYGESGAFEEAYRCWQRAEKYTGLQLNAENMVRQHQAAREDRAPLYAGPDEGGTLLRGTYLPDDHEDSMLRKTALWVLGNICDGSPASAWTCEHGTREGTGRDDDGVLYCTEYDDPGEGE